MMDPVITAITEYRDGIKAFNICEDGREDQSSYLWRDPFYRILEARRAATTREGAIEALRLAIEEEEIGDSPLIPVLIASALAYLEKAA